MLEQALVRLASDVAIDLGTSNTRVFVRGRGIVVEEPSVVAVERTGSGSRVLAIGTDAKRMLGRTPEHITAVNPIQYGVVSDFALAESLLRDCFERAVTSRPLIKPRMVVCVAESTTDVQRRAVQESARAAGAREVRLVPKSAAAAVGADLPIRQPTACVIMDIGGGTTEICVISLGGIVDVASIPVAGSALDTAIAAWIRERHNVLVGERAAEEVKLAVGCALPGESSRRTRVTGRDLTTGIPREVEVSSDDIAEGIRAPLLRMVEALRQVLSQLPPELSSDIADHGVMLSGGSAPLPALGHYIGEMTGLAVIQAEDPHRATAIGAGRLLDDPATLDRLAFSTARPARSKGGGEP